jgi:hypothetical protein
MRPRLIFTSLALAAVLALLPAAALAAAPPRTMKGSVTYVGSSSFTVQTSGRRTGMINALTAAGNVVTRGNYPYVWGGGHAAAGAAGVGIKGPGHNGRRTGYDCSGAVAAVLTGAGLWAAGSPVPNDAGVISQLLQEKLIARGPGTAPNEVTLYDHPGVHIFMNINGRFFGTSDGGGGNPSQTKGGAGWLDDGAPDATSRAFKQYHVLPSVLKNRATYGHAFTFGIGANAALLASMAVGDSLQVTYQGTSFGSMIASTVGWVGAVSASATVASIAADGSSFTVTTAGGQTLTLSTGTNPSLLDGLQVGDTIDVTYTKAATGALVARALTVTATPVPSQATGTIVAIAADLSSFTLQTTGGQTMTFSTAGSTGILAGVQVGESVQVSYTQSTGGALTAVEISPQSAATGPYRGGR